MWVKQGEDNLRKMEKEAEIERRRWQKAEKEERRREQKRLEEDEKRRRKEEKRLLKMMKTSDRESGGKGASSERGGLDPRTTVDLSRGTGSIQGRRSALRGESLNPVITNRPTGCWEAKAGRCFAPISPPRGNSTWRGYGSSAEPASRC